MIVVEMRVFPFSFPPIRGGAQGGATPTPIPEPEDYPYDDTNLAVASVLVVMRGGDATKWDWSAIGGNSVAGAKFTFSGIVVDDVSNVASIVFDTSALDWTANGTSVTYEQYDNTYSIIHTYTGAEISNPNVSFYVAIDTTSNVGGQTVDVSGDITITAYDSNGVALQTMTVGVSL